MPVAVREKMLKFTPSPKTVAPIGALCPGPTPFWRRSNRLGKELLIASGYDLRLARSEANMLTSMATIATR